MKRGGVIVVHGLVQMCIYSRPVDVMHKVKRDNIRGE